MMKKNNEFVAAKPHATLTTGEVIRMLRELKGWTQEQLAKASRLRRGYGGHVGSTPPSSCSPNTKPT
jgi:hypothetical protein